MCVFLAFSLFLKRRRRRRKRQFLSLKSFFEKKKFIWNFEKWVLDFIKENYFGRKKTTFGDILKKEIFSWIFWKIFLKHSWVFLGNNIFNEKEIYHELLERKWDFMKYSFEKLFFFFFPKGKWNFICLKKLL